jgi:hypothetical protein
MLFGAGPKLRAGDTNKAVTKMRSKQIVLVKIPVSLNEVAVVRREDLAQGIMHSLAEFYKCRDVENRIGIASNKDFDMVKKNVMVLLGDKMSCKLNVLNLYTQISEVKNYSVTLLKWTIPLLKYHNRPVSDVERDKPLRSMIKKDLDRFSQMMKGMGADLPSRSIACELIKDENVIALLAANNMDKIYYSDTNGQGEMFVKSSQQIGDFVDGKLHENTAVLFIKLEQGAD